MTTDKERLDFLQELTEGYGRGWVLRRSTTGRGWRLHETSAITGTPNIRDAIDSVIEIDRETKKISPDIRPSDEGGLAQKTQREDK